MDTPEMQKKREAEELAAKQKAEADAIAAAGDKYTIEELYKKILKVEKLSDMVKANNMNSKANFWAKNGNIYIWSSYAIGQKDFYDKALIITIITRKPRVNIKLN